MPEVSKRQSKHKSTEHVPIEWFWWQPWFIEALFWRLEQSWRLLKITTTKTPPQKHHRKNTTTRTPPQKHHHTTTKTPPQQHHHTNTTTKTPPQKHHHKNTTAQTPPQKHRHKNTTARTPPQEHHHKNTAAKTPPQKHHRKNTTARTPPQEHHHKNTTTKTPPHHHKNTTTKAPPQEHKTPPQKHHHTNTTTKTPPHKHHHKNTTTQTPPQNNHYKNTTTKTPPQEHHHKNTTTKTPPHFATAAYHFSTSELQKVVRNWRVLYIFTSQRAFHHSGVQFFDIWTSKSAPSTSCFVHFQPNVLFTTAACNFSTSELQKVLRAPHVLCIFTSQCAFRHSGVQFLIHPLTTWLRARRFNRPTFRLTRHTNPRENTAFRDFSNVWRGCIFFLLTFALLHLLSADLTTLLCFWTVHIVRSFYLNFLGLVSFHPSSYWKVCATLPRRSWIFGIALKFRPVRGRSCGVPAGPIWGKQSSHGASSCKLGCDVWPVRSDAVFFFSFLRAIVTAVSLTTFANIERPKMWNRQFQMVGLSKVICKRSGNRLQSLDRQMAYLYNPLTWHIVIFSRLPKPLRCAIAIYAEFSNNIDTWKAAKNPLCVILLVTVGDPPH